MNGLNGKPTEYPENALVPYPVILEWTKKYAKGCKQN